MYTLLFDATFGENELWLINLLNKLTFGKVKRKTIFWIQGKNKWTSVKKTYIIQPLTII